MIVPIAAFLQYKNFLVYFREGFIEQVQFKNKNNR